MSDSALDRQTADSFYAQGMLRHFGAELVEAANGRCVIELPYGEHLTQQNGLFHGGVVAGIADAACGHAAFTLAPEGANVVSVEYKLNHIPPADGERLRATATVLKQGRTISVVATRVDTLRAGEWRHCGEMLGTMFVKPPRTGDTV
jgi:uncharacterized protein (TIGR00369 family)